MVDVPPSGIEEAYAARGASDVRYRFVVDGSTFGP
jgi:hypothetical protein